MYRVLTALGALALGATIIFSVETAIFSSLDSLVGTIGFVGFVLSFCGVVLALIHALVTRRLLVMFGFGMLLPLGEFGWLGTPYIGVAWLVLDNLPPLAVCAYGIWLWWAAHLARAQPVAKRE